VDLINEIATGNLPDDADLARAYWEALADQFPSRIQVREGRIPASEIREG
jgi:DNA sulfur modification protein DndB